MTSPTYDPRYFSVVHGMRATPRGLVTYGDATRIKGHATYAEAIAELAGAQARYPEWGTFEVRKAGPGPGLREVYGWSDHGFPVLKHREAY